MKHVSVYPFKMEFLVLFYYFRCSSKHLLDSLQRVQNNAARLIVKVRKSSHITPHLMSLHWLPVNSRIDYKLASLCHSCLHGDAPEYLKTLIPLKEYSHEYKTRSRSDSTSLQEKPSTSQKTICDRCFSYAAPEVWKSIPIDLRVTPSSSTFKSGLKTHLFKRAY